MSYTYWTPGKYHCKYCGLDSDTPIFCCEDCYEVFEADSGDDYYEDDEDYDKEDYDEEDYYEEYISDEFDDEYDDN